MSDHTERAVAADVVVALLNGGFLGRTKANVAKVVELLGLTQAHLAAALDRLNGREGRVRTLTDLPYMYDARLHGGGQPEQSRPSRGGSHHSRPRASQPTSQPTDQENADMADLMKRLSEALATTTDPQEAARMVLSATRRTERDEYLLDLLADRAANALRNQTRVKERRVAAEIAAGADPVAALRELTGSGFHLPDTTYVLHLEATAEQHRLRAGWCTERANGLMATAKFHEDCAAVIEEAGVTCLADLDPTLHPAKAA